MEFHCSPRLPFSLLALRKKKRLLKKKKAIIDFTLTSYNTALGRVKILSEAQAAHQRKN